jgi:cysteinyl-tRNA synthetase
MADAALGIFPSPQGEAAGDDSEIDALVAARETARQEKNWPEADSIRDQLLERGIVIEDTPHGPVWHRD